MKLAFSIAFRYLFARKSQNVINIISMISVTGVMTGTLALLIVLSVFNGLHGLIGTLYGSFDPDIRIEPLEGKVFSVNSLPYEKLCNTLGIKAISQVVTDQALLRNGAQRQMPAMVMGVDPSFNKVSGIDSIMTEGAFRLKNEQQIDMGAIGFILADQLAVRVNFVTPLGIYVPKRSGSLNLMNPESGFKTDYIMPSGVFAVKQVEYDSQYLIIGIEKARWLLDYDSTMVSYLFLKTDPSVDQQTLKKEIQTLVGQNFRVKNKEEQHDAFFKMMRIEKLMSYLILSFILVIAAFNVIGSLSLLIFEKKESIFTLKSMGASRQLVTRIFLFEGWMISLVGVFIGLLLGILLIVIQQQFGIVKFMGDNSFVTDAYPVVLKLKDVTIVFVTVATIGFLAAWYPVRAIVKKHYSSREG